MSAKDEKEPSFSVAMQELETIRSVNLMMQEATVDL